MAGEDFVFSVILKAENGDLVGSVNVSKQAMEAMKASAKGAGDGMRQLDGETKKATSSAKADSAARRDAKAAKDAEAAAARDAAAAQRKLSEAQREATRQAGRTRAGMAQLGQQMQDVSYQFTAGVPPMIIFAQQGGQVATAFSQMGGAVGAVGRFLAGPWGVALTTAGLAVAALSGKLSYASDAAKDAEDANLSLADAVKKLDEATGAAKKTQEESIELREKETLKLRAETVETLNTAKAKLVLAAAAIKAAEATRRGSSEDGSIGGVTAGIGISLAKNQADAIREQIAGIEKEIAKADASLRGVGIARAMREIEAETDKAAAATQKYEREMSKLRHAARTNKISEEEFKKQALALEKTKNAALEAARATDTGAKSSREATAALKAQAQQMEALADAATRASVAMEGFGVSNAAAMAKAREDAYVKQYGIEGGIYGTGLGTILEESMTPVKEAGDDFKKNVSSAGYSFAEALGDVIGGRGGRRISGILGLAGFNDENSPFGKEFKAGWKKVSDGFGEQLSKIFGQNGSKFASTLGQAGAAWSIGSEVGGLADGIMDAIGIKSSKLGAQLGGTIGTAVGGPIGAVIGSIGGGLIGGLFKKARTAGATITGVDSDIALGGKDKKGYDTASSLGGAVQQGIAQIADMLGGTLGGFKLTIGTRDDDFRVNTTGSTSLKLKNGARNFGDDQAGAIAFAITEAIAQGAVGGLSAAVQKALKSSPDLDKAVKEAVLVQGVEELLGGIAGAAKKAFTEFENTAKERARVARQYGFDLVEIERINAEQRAALFESQMQGAVGSLKALLDSYKFGDNAGGTILDRRSALLSEAESLAAKAPTDSAAADRLAQVLEMLQEVSTTAFGTAGAGAAGDRSQIISTAERIVADTAARLKAEQDAAVAAAAKDQAAEKLDTTNKTLDEMSDQLAQILAALGGVVGAKTAPAGTALDLTALQRLAIAQQIGRGLF